MGKLVKQETNPNRYHVYIIEETQVHSEIPVQTMYRKIGILAESQVGQQEAFYGRERALNQGNVRPLKVVFSVMTDSKVSAAIIEKRVHERLLEMGFESLYETTQATGHAEWFNCPRAVAEKCIRESYQLYQDELDTKRLFLDLPERPKVGTHRVKKEEIVYTTCDDLFK